MKVLLIESRALVRIALRKLLEAVAAVDEVVAIEPGEIPRHRAYGEAIGVIVLGLPENLDDATHLLGIVGRTWPRSRVLLMADAASTQWPSGTLAPNVVGCLPKCVPLAVLEASLRLVASGFQVSFGQFSQRPGLTTAARQRNGKAAGPQDAPPVTAPGSPGIAFDRDEASLLGLTSRQYEVLVLLARGHPAKTIGRRLNISVATVKSHTYAIYKVLQVRNRGEAVHVAMQRGARLEAGDGNSSPPHQARPTAL